jgi:hypothetical protein
VCHLLTAGHLKSGRRLAAGARAAGGGERVRPLEASLAGVDSFQGPSLVPCIISNDCCAGIYAARALLSH